MGGRTFWFRIIIKIRLDKYPPMSSYYNPQRSRNIFDPKSREPFTVSRSGIDLFVQCQRCFYLDKRLGTARPPGFPFSLNSAVDALLKKEFDIHRAAGTAHPLMKEYDIDAIPYAHKVKQILLAQH